MSKSILRFPSGKRVTPEDRSLSDRRAPEAIISSEVDDLTERLKLKLHRAVVEKPSGRSYEETMAISLFTPRNLQDCVKEESSREGYEALVHQLINAILSSGQTHAAHAIAGDSGTEIEYVGLPAEDPNYANLELFVRERPQLLITHRNQYVAYSAGVRVAIGHDFEAVAREAENRVPAGMILIEQIVPEADVPVVTFAGLRRITFD